MHDRLFEAALGIAPPWFVVGVKFDEASKVLTVGIDYAVGSRFGVDGVAGEHPVHDTVTKVYRHLNFFQHECVLEVRTPRVKLPDGSVRLVKPPFAGKLSGFTLLFEALVLMLAPQMPFAAVARIVGISAHRVLAICRRYVALALAAANFGEVKALAIDETSRARGHDYITLAADAIERRVLSVTEGRDAKAVKTIASELADHGCPPEQIESVSIDMSPAFIKGFFRCENSSNSYALGHFSRQHLVPVLRHPHEVILDLKDRMTPVPVVHAQHLRCRILELKLTG